MKISKPKSPFWRYIIYCLQWLASLGGLIYACSGIDIRGLLAAYDSFKLEPTAYILLFCLVEYLLQGYRLRLLLGSSISFLQGIKATILCLGFNAMLPAKAGDVIKLVWLCKERNKNIFEISPVVMWERIFDIIILLGIMIYLVTLMKMQEISFVLIFSVVSICGFSIIKIYSCKIKKCYLRFLPKKFHTPILLLHVNLIDKPSLAWLGKGLLLTLAVWAVRYITFLIALNFIAGFNLGYGGIFYVFAITSAGSAIPSAPGNIGLFEGCMVLALTGEGIGHDDAFGIAVYLHLLFLLVPVTGSLALQANFTWKNTRSCAH